MGELNISLEWRPIGEVLRFEGLALKEGIWVGLNKIPILYSQNVIESAAAQLTNKPVVKAGHAETPEAFVGFVTDVDYRDGELWVRGYVFDNETIDAILKGERVGLSIEATAKTRPGDGHQIAAALDISPVALVRSPACEPCLITSTKVVQMSATNNTTPLTVTNSQVTTMSEEPQLDFDLSEIIEPIEEEVEGQKPTKVEFFRWLEGQLKAAGVKGKILDAVMDILRKAIKVPYPYPYPAPVKKGTEEEDIEIEVDGQQKPSREAFFQWIADRLKEANVPQTQIEKVLAVLKTAIKTPYPYPAPTAYPKPTAGGPEEVEKMKEEALAWKSKYEELLASTEKKELDSIVSEIKKLNPEFDPNSIIGSVSDFGTQKALLSVHLEGLRRVAPPKPVKLSADTSSEFRQRVDKQAKALFGKEYEQLLKELEG